MPEYKMVDVSGFQTRKWVDKASGEERSLRVLQGSTTMSVEFVVDADQETRYTPFVGKRVMVPYVRRGTYENIDNSSRPIPVN